MKKVIRPWENRYRHINLYKNDVENIIKIVQTELSTKARIRIDEFILEDDKELNEIDKETVNELFISVGGDAFMIHLGKECAYLSISDENDNKLRGVASRIDAILREKQGLLSLIFYRPQSWIVTSMLSGGAGCFLIIAIVAKAPISLFIFIALVIAFILDLTLYAYFYHHYTIIHMCNPSEKQNLFKRKKDDILVGIIISIVSLIIGVLGTLIYQRINKIGQKLSSSTQNNLTNNQDANDSK